MDRQRLKILILFPSLLVIALIIGIVWRYVDTEPGTKSPPIIIYLVDTLRSDRLGAYGYPLDISPRLDAIARESVIFTNAYSPAAWTLPSVASLITSTYSCAHGVVERSKSLSASIPTLAERLKSAGYSTAAYYTNIFPGPVAGLDRGYDISEYRNHMESHSNLKPEVRDYLNEHGTEPFFLYLHTMEPHEAYETPYQFITEFGHIGVDEKAAFKSASWQYKAETTINDSAGLPLGTSDNLELIEEADARLNDLRDEVRVLYDASILWADSNLGDVIDVLKRQDIWDKAIFIFLSDHGEEFGEHGGWFHGQSVYEEMIRVPLIIHFPDDQYGGQTVDNPVSLVDVMPSLLDYLGDIGSCDDCQGSSLLPLLQQPQEFPEERSPVKSMRDNKFQYHPAWKENRGDVNLVIRQNQWKGIWNDELQSVELYDLAEDANESFDRGSQNPDLAQTITERARNWLETCRSVRKEPTEVPKLDYVTEERLRALGYIR